MPEITHKRITVSNRIDPASQEIAMAELQSALAENPRRVPTKFLYDERGSLLFEEITSLPEYYPTRSERALLNRYAGEIVAITECEELVELGAGAATKTRVLLNAMETADKLRLYVPFDFSETEVGRVAEELSNEYPSLQIHGIVADFVHHLGAIPSGSQRLVLLLGSTIGNFSNPEAVAFLRRISHHMAPGDYFLLGVDLIKKVAIIEAAYNDSTGKTAEFNRNILRVVNAQAESNFDLEKFDHLAFYNSELDRIEMYLVATQIMNIRLEKLGIDIEFAKGESLFTEISCKYDQALVESMLAESGFGLSRWYADSDQMFALALARKLG